MKSWRCWLKVRVASQLAAEKRVLWYQLWDCITLLKFRLNAKVVSIQLKRRSQSWYQRIHAGANWEATTKDRATCCGWRPWKDTPIWEFKSSDVLITGQSGSTHAAAGEEVPFESHYPNNAWVRQHMASDLNSLLAVDVGMQWVLVFMDIGQVVIGVVMFQHSMLKEGSKKETYTVCRMLDRLPEPLLRKL